MQEHNRRAVTKSPVENLSIAAFDLAEEDRLHSSD